MKKTVLSRNKCKVAVSRQEATQVEPPPAKTSFNGLLFKQSRRGDVLIVSRTLAARMAAPHTLQLDHLKLSSCCLIEGQMLKNCLAVACLELPVFCMTLAAGMLHDLRCYVA